MAAPKSKTAAPVKGKVKMRKKEKKNVAVGNAYIKSTFNNTIISITDTTGAVISWASSGQVGFKGSRKSTPFAAQLAAEAAAARIHAETEFGDVLYDDNYLDFPGESELDSY